MFFQTFWEDGFHMGLKILTEMFGFPKSETRSED